MILFLFCLPDLKTLYSFGGPQPFVEIYALTMGRGGHIFMNVVCIIGLMFNTTIAGVASSRLIWAVARDGVLPFSGWISQVSEKKEPKNAIIVMHGTAALLLCTILPSPVAFTSLVSAAGVPTITAYALIAFGRCFITPHNFKHAALQSRTVEPPYDVHHAGLELVLGLRAVLAVVLPRDGGRVQLLARYLWRYHLCLGSSRGGSRRRIGGYRTRGWARFISSMTSIVGMMYVSETRGCMVAGWSLEKPAIEVEGKGQIYPRGKRLGWS